MYCRLKYNTRHVRKTPVYRITMERIQVGSDRKTLSRADGLKYGAAFVPN